MKNTDKLLAVDPSLTCSGWALFASHTERLLAVGSITTLGPEYSLAERLQRLQDNISVVFKQLNLGSGDFLICEDATSMKDPLAVVKVEQVRGIFETLARSRKVTVPGRIHPRTIQNDLLGLRGKQLERHLVKQAACGTVMHLYGEALKGLNFEISERNLTKNQDIVDAVLIGALSLSKIQEANRAGVSLDEHLQTGRRDNRRAMRVGRG